jgi:FixJ family two-component response regulator
MQHRATVFVVERDPDVRERIGALIASAGLFVRTFPSAPHFLAGFDRDDPGCLVLRMRGSGGLELQDRLMRRGAVLPIIVLTASAERPPDAASPDQLLDCVRRAIELDRHVRDLRRKRAGIADLIGRLTPRERDVLKLVVAGMANKVIASELGISQKTVEIHRGRVMKKMKAGSVADLVRLWEIWTVTGNGNGAPKEGTIIYCRGGDG